MRVKKLFSGLFFVGLTANLIGQAPHRCGADQLLERHIAANPALQTAMERADQEWAQVAAQGFTPRGGIRKIPVVVHIIQSNSQIRISDDRILSQIQVLNEDFRLLNADTTVIPLEHKPVASDFEIEFCLATIDPNGCATSGINRIISPANAIHDMADEAQLKALIQWDPHKYLNIWVPENTPTLLGYATFPGSLTFNPQLDGVVINGQNIGRGFGTPPGSYALGRTATHEIGHWLGLFHTFQGGCSGTSSTNCASQGDRICDTPPTAVENYGCPSPKNSCTETPVDMPDQLVNFMDYGDDPCLVMFSEGQKSRVYLYMDNFRSQIFSASNLTATGCDGTVSAGCTPVANFIADNVSACTGQAVQFTDISVGPATSWQWSFPGGNPSTSTQQNPIVTYDTAGVYNVTMTVTNSFGTDSQTSTSFITVSTSSPAPLVESFEGITNLPFGWSTADEDGAGTWSLHTTAASQGQNSIRMPNFTLQGTGSTDGLVSEPFDLSGFGAATLRYDRAYKRKNAFAVDSFRVDVSTDCGATWTRVRTLHGSILATIPGLATSVAYAPAAADWKSDTLDLTPFAGEPVVKVRFELKSGGGQNLYLDNINMDVVVGQVEQQNNLRAIRLVPNPSSGTLPEITYTRARAGSLQISVFSLDGREIGNMEVGMQSAGQHRLSLGGLNVDRLPSGMYLVKVQTEGTSTMLRWIKQD